MADKEEKLVKQPEVSKLHVMELVQFMARPLKHLEDQVREHMNEYVLYKKDAEAKLAKMGDEVAESRSEVVRMEGEVQRAKAEACKAMNESSKADGMPQAMEKLRMELADCRDQLKVIDGMRADHKELFNALEVVRKGLKGAAEAHEAHKSHALDVEAQHKQHLHQHAQDLKVASKELLELRSDMNADREYMKSLVDEAMLEVKNLRRDMGQAVEQHRQAADGAFAELKMRVQEEMDKQRMQSQKSASDVAGNLDLFQEHCEYMDIARKNISTLERRMDKVMAFMKEVQAQFELED